MFNSRDPLYKNPTGAIKNGQSIHFKITLPRDFHCSAAYLLVDKDGREPRYFDMFWCGMNGDSAEWWECDFAPEETGLYFYYFEFKTDHGRRRLSRGHSGEAVPQGYDKWQLTVYSKDYKVPDWLRGGLIYQIFPDRFYRSDKTNFDLTDDKYSYRRLHQNWDETPDWRPNHTGKIENDDFFAGNLKGVEEKLPYLASLGITCIYLNPIFESFSNHRYDTADYSVIDPMLGTEADFTSLCSAAKKLGIKVIIDGVFNHTGSDSIYFNKSRRYGDGGAYNSQQSPYYSWYSFTNWPDEYESWWGFDTLPNLNENNEDFLKYMVGENGIVRKWIRAGAAGWRLDVADELPDAFLDEINRAAKEENPDSIVLGEVWEDASSKSAYGVRRRYLLGGQLDSVMNYPFRDAIFAYIIDGNTAFCFEQIESVLENYPPDCINSLMNHIGTHDTVRAITALAGENVGNNTREWQSEHSLSPSQRETGLYRMRLASLMQYTLPGVPSLYYGDEVGVEGYRDPFNRATFPWESGDNELMLWYQSLGKFRKETPILIDGKFRKVAADCDFIAYERYKERSGGEDVLLVILNRGGKIYLMPPHLIPTTAISTLGVDIREKQLELAPFGYAVYEYKNMSEIKPEETDEISPDDGDIKIAKY